MAAGPIKDWDKKIFHDKDFGPFVYERSNEPEWVIIVDGKSYLMAKLKKNYLESITPCQHCEKANVRALPELTSHV